MFITSLNSQRTLGIMLNILLIADIVSKIISLVIFVCLAMWSIRNLKDHDVSYATAILRQVIKTIVSKGLLYFTGGPAERSIIRSIIGTITPNAYWSTHTVIDQSPRPLVRPLVRLMHQAYWPTHTVLDQSTGRWLGPSAEWNRPLLAGRTASVMAAYRPHPKFGDIDPVVSVEIIRIETDIDSFFYPPCIPMPFLGKALNPVPVWLMLVIPSMFGYG